MVGRVIPPSKISRSEYVESVNVTWQKDFADVIKNLEMGLSEYLDGSSVIKVQHFSMRPCITSDG